MRQRSHDKVSRLDVWVERILRKEERLRAKVTETRSGTVGSVLSREALVHTDDGVVDAALGTYAVVVGDHVTVGILEGGWQIIKTLPRRTKVSRPDVQDARIERLIAANVDSVVIVVSVVSPPLHPRLIDRYLIAIQHGGAQPVLCVNKMDLLEDASELECLEVHRANGIPVFLCSTKEGEGIEELRAQVKGETIVFVGHSGVGKSSLINAFAPSLGLKTGATSEGYGRGTHTTTVSSRHELLDGTIVIDTPGVRSFGLWAASGVELDAAFPEIASIQCRFRDCQHRTEPGCGVLEALERGEVSEERYAAYEKLKAEIGG